MLNDVPPPPSELFKEYQKINAHKTAKNMMKGPENELKWVALEKVHGANFCMIHDGTNLFCCRRNDILHDHETFYNFQLVRDRYRDHMAKLFSLVAEPDVLSRVVENGTKLERIMIYGELFGGVYPHTEVEDKGYLHIQKGVYYAADIDFYAFDVAVKVEGEEAKWMNYDLAIELFEKIGFFYSKPLLVGTLQECLNYDITFNSTIPQLLGLPTLQKNQCEGIVVKVRLTFQI
jgi:Rnl2 family RNA ligase